MVSILLIDDDPAVCDSTSAILCSYGHSVTSASDGEQALKQLETSAFDLIITDIMMPNMDGIELVRKIRSLHPTLKIIAMSGGSPLAKFRYLEAAGALGADEIIEKPFEEGHLLALIQRLTA